MSGEEWQSVTALIQAVRHDQRTSLLETEGKEILHLLGISTPRRLDLAHPQDFLKIDPERFQKKFHKEFQGNQVVLKVVSSEILHKTELGAVQVLPKTHHAISEALQEMHGRLAGNFKIQGYTINEFVTYDTALGGELLLGARYTEDFGPIVTLGIGGIYTEVVAKLLRPGKELGILSPALGQDRRTLERALSSVAAFELVTREFRGKEARLSLDTLYEVLARFARFAEKFIPKDFQEIEINPVVVTSRGLVGLDFLAQLSTPSTPSTPLELPRPIQKVAKLLHPETIAVIGVSSEKGARSSPSPGRVILENILAAGFREKAVHVIKPGTQEICGCACVPDLASLPSKVDLLVIAVSAAQVPDLVTQAITLQKAESLIIIPGGFEEKAGSEQLTGSMKAALRAARKTPWQGPIMNGANCLGIRSLPGQFNTLFIPAHKLPLPHQEASPVALISQSGAFAISRLNRFTGLDPKYTISLGNQMDLTLGDCLEFLKEDPEIKVFAIYVEGFKPLDGLKFLQMAREIIQSGKRVILYRAARTDAGAQASASHTASIAGSFAVTRELCRQVGITQVESIADFEDVLKLFTFFQAERKIERGPTRRLGVVSNAGFECVAAADSLGDLKLTQWSPSTLNKLTELLKTFKLHSLVDVHNPLDLTPMCNDAGYEAVTRAILEDSGLDLAVVGLVPLTAALQTLSAAPDQHGEDFLNPESIAQKLLHVFHQTRKPWVVVIDGGRLYDGICEFLEQNRLPVFRTMDQAIRILSHW